jgi:rubrerythrin
MGFCCCWISVIGAALVGVYAFFKARKKLGTVVLIGAIASGGVMLYTEQKTEKLNAATLSEYDAVTMYNALYESTHDEIYKEIAKDESWHYKYLSGYGYTPVGNVSSYPLTLEGAIKSEQDAIKMYEDILSYTVLDNALKSDIQRILSDEKEHLNELIEFSAKETNGISDIVDGFNIDEIGIRIRELLSGVRVRIKNMIGVRE